jgi:hypothetical protein
MNMMMRVRGNFEEEKIFQENIGIILLQCIKYLDSRFSGHFIHYIRILDRKRMNTLKSWWNEVIKTKSLTHSIPPTTHSSPLRTKICMISLIYIRGIA